MKKTIIANRMTPKLANVLWQLMKCKKQRKFVVNGAKISNKN